MEIVKIFPVHIREALANDTWKAGLEEIRVRVAVRLNLFTAGRAATCRGGRARMHCLLPADMRTAIG